MAIGKNGGISGAGSLLQEDHAYHVAWSAGAEFIGTAAPSIQGVEVCVKGEAKSGDFQADSGVAVA